MRSTRAVEFVSKLYPQFSLANKISTYLSSAGLYALGIVSIGIGALQRFRGVEAVICFVGRGFSSILELNLPDARFLSMWGLEGAKLSQF